MDAAGWLRIDRIHEAPAQRFSDIHSPQEVWSIEYHPEKNSLSRLAMAGLLRCILNKERKHDSGRSIVITW
jgi:hypothetical protein